MGFGLRHRELILDGGSELEFDKLYKFFKQFLLKEHNEDGTHITTPATSGTASNTLAYVTVSNTSELTSERALVGTANQVTVTDGGANSNVVLGLPQDINVGASPTFATVKHSNLTSGRVPIVTTDGALTDDADLTFATDTLTVAKTVTSTSQTLGGAAAAATTAYSLTKKITGIADNTATTVFTLTIPNGRHAATARLLFLSSNGSTDAFESSRTASGSVVIARTTGLNAVVAASAIAHEQIATVAGGATHTLAYSVSAVSGAVGATNTCDIQVTVDDSGNLGSNQVVCFVQLLNSEASGVTIA